MITSLQLIVLLLLISFIFILIVYIVKKKFKSIKDLVWDSIFDAATLNSGFIILFFLIGKLFNVPLFQQIDDYSLIFGLIVSMVVIFTGIIEKLFVKNEKQN